MGGLEKRICFGKMYYILIKFSFQIYMKEKIVALQKQYLQGLYINKKNCVFIDSIAMIA